jgi:site-specific recombinase XerD
VELLIPARARVGGREGLHVMLTTGATNTLDSGADIARIQEYLGYANIATTRTYDHCKTRPGG